MQNHAYIPSKIISRLSELTGAELKVLVILLSHADKNSGELFVSRYKISELTGYIPNNITRITRSLVAKNFIKKSDQRSTEAIIYQIIGWDFNVNCNNFKQNRGITTDTPPAGIDKNSNNRGITTDTGGITQDTPNINEGYQNEHFGGVRGITTDTPTPKTAQNSNNRGITQDTQGITTDTLTNKYKYNNITSDNVFIPSTPQPSKNSPQDLSNFNAKKMHNDFVEKNNLDVGDLKIQCEKFKAHYLSNGFECRDWDQKFNSWLLTAHDMKQQRSDNYATRSKSNTRSKQNGLGRLADKFSDRVRGK